MITPLIPVFPEMQRRIDEGEKMLKLVVERLKILEVECQTLVSVIERTLATLGNGLK